MNALTKILSSIVRDINAEERVKLKKVAEFGDEEKGSGVYRDAENNEYRVVFVQASAHMKDADYHTDDKQDAISTAEYGNKTAALKEIEASVEAEEYSVPTRSRPRGYNEQPCKLLRGLFARAGM